MNFDDIRAEALGALSAFWESDEAPKQPARKVTSKKKSPAKRKRKPVAKRNHVTVAALPAKVYAPSVGKGSAYGDMAGTIAAALGDANE